ncbi:hypothetical protein [Pedobacter aquatilis]|uniref:hypothetical protein n=1 Tax=Pedobacter aquatilis TaxID=351343 RepID=UPI00292F327B|nr:hypothetical protein [Pedobacter aquatilis]
MTTYNPFTSTIYHSVLESFYQEYNPILETNSNTPSTFYLLHKGGKYKAHKLKLDFFFDTVEVHSKYNLTTDEGEEITRDAKAILLKVKKHLHSQYLDAAKVFEHSLMGGTANEEADKQVKESKLPPMFKEMLDKINNDFLKLNSLNND